MSKRSLTDGQIFLLAWAARQSAGTLYTGSQVPLSVETARGRIDQPLGVSMAGLIGLERRGYFTRRQAFFELTDAGGRALHASETAARIDALVALTEAARHLAD